MAVRWTSSGPSARRKTLAHAKNCARGVSAESPRAPCAWHGEEGGEGRREGRKEGNYHTEKCKQKGTNKYTLQAQGGGGDGGGDGGSDSGGVTHLYGSVNNSLGSERSYCLDHSYLLFGSLEVYFH